MGLKKTYHMFISNTVVCGCVGGFFSWCDIVLMGIHESGETKKKLGLNY